ncbi:PAS domain S-box protein [Candidatus Amarolinea dominans]|uniref:PAS domain S-box protein n=1 Tax=Candidatus Amarolinea dominans TaxID=3140696 RepID=UPI0031CC4183
MSTILIVDDNEQNRYLLRLTLIASSYEVLEAGNGVEALALARRARPNLIISDILMPQMDGFALCRECKRDEQLRAIPFVFYTGTYADPRDEALALQLGAARFVIKPVESEEFIGMVREVLQAQAHGQLTAPQPPQTEETALYQLYNQALVRKLEDKMLELEQVNRTLAESEERFRRLTETTSAAIFIFQDETIVYANRACELLSGYSKAELLSMPFMQVVHPAHEDSVRQRILAHRQGKPTPTGFEFGFLHQDGSERWVHFTGGPIEWYGKPAIIGSATDITEGKRAEEETRLLQTVARGIGEAEDLNGALAFVLQHVCETTGWVMGEAWFPSRDGARLECHPVWHSRAPGLEEFRQVSQSFVFAPGEGLPGAVWFAKEPLWIEDVGAAANFPRRTATLNAGLKAAVGIPVLALGQVVLVMDFFLREPRAEDRRMVELIATVAAQVGLLIERKQAQDALRRSEEHFRVLIENASDIITVLDQDGTIRYGSPAVERVLGYRQQELMGTNTFELVHPDDLPRALDVFRRGLSHSGVVSEAVELRCRHKDGSWRMLEALGRSLVDESGQTIAVIHSRDITERKQRERELEAQAMLAQAVGETPELQPLLERLLLAARHAIPAAEKGSVLLVEPDGRLRVRALSGYADPRLHHFYFAGDSGYAALTAREQKPLLITDARTDPAHALRRRHRGGARHSERGYRAARHPEARHRRSYARCHAPGRIF